MILLLKIVSKGVLIKQQTVCILPYTEDGKFLFEDGKLGTSLFRIGWCPDNNFSLLENLYEFARGLLESLAYVICTEELKEYTEDGDTDWVVHTVCVKLNTCKKLKRDTVIISFDKENGIDGVRDRLREIDADFELDYLRGVLENISEFIYRELITIR